MKRLIISLILIFALTNQAFALGSHGGGGGGKSAVTSSGGKSNTDANANNTTNGTEGQEGSITNIISTPEGISIILLGSGLFALWIARKKFKK